MAELLLELLSEEIPAKVQDRAKTDLQRLVLGVLDAHGLCYGASHNYATPRRLALVVETVQASQADQQIERRGPRLDAPGKARDGFLRGLGEVDYELGQIDDKKGSFLLARFVVPGRSAKTILGEALPELLSQFPWPKSMRWGTGHERWVRPLQGISCLLGGEVVPFSALEITSGAGTVGHRFMGPAPFDFADFSIYRSRLRAAHVILDADERRTYIADLASQLARSVGLVLRQDQALLDEIKGLVEWPVPILGRIDDAFMELPAEVLTTSMREHQKYLTLETQEGNLAPYFVAVANISASDGGQAIRAGNERVLRARLWDAQFFWDQDRRVRLEDRLDALRAMVFHADLGTLHAKAERLGLLASALASWIEGADAGLAAKAGQLAKADLVTGMVGEFPELQGVMGGYYARSEGLDPQIADAIAGHYRFGGEPLPGPVACALALADKLDTLCGFFMIGIKPTGSKDPFALRRMAAGIAWVIRAHDLRLGLRDAISAAIDGYPESLLPVDQGKTQLIDDILQFIKHRGNAVEVLQETTRLGTYPFNIPAVFATVAANPDDDLVRLDKLRGALLDLLATADGQSLMAAYRRAANILRLECKKDKVERMDGLVEPGLLKAAEEAQLFAELDQLQVSLDDDMQQERYTAAMRSLANLRPTIDAFFDGVMVNAEEPEIRVNRLRLLTLFCARAERIANFSLIED